MTYAILILASIQAALLTCSIYGIANNAYYVESKFSISMIAGPNEIATALN